MCSSMVALGEGGGLNLTSTFLRWAGGAAPGVGELTAQGRGPGAAPGLTLDPSGDLPAGRTTVRPGPYCCCLQAPQAATATPAPVSGPPSREPWAQPWVDTGSQQSAGGRDGRSTTVSKPRAWSPSAPGSRAGLRNPLSWAPDPLWSPPASSLSLDGISCLIAAGQGRTHRQPQPPPCLRTAHCPPPQPQATLLSRTASPLGNILSSQF